MAADGHGGIWIADATGRRYGSALYDYRGGVWSRPQILAKPGRNVFITSLATPAATATMWAAGYGGTNDGNARARMLLYTYSR